jgi:hypothetical protein
MSSRAYWIVMFLIGVALVGFLGIQVWGMVRCYQLGGHFTGQICLKGETISLN